MIRYCPSTPGACSARLATRERDEDKLTSSNYRAFLRLLWTTILLLLTATAQAREVVDMAGRQVTVPDRVARIACLEVLCYQKLFLLGVSDRITEMTMTTAPWKIGRASCRERVYVLV